MPDEAKPSPDPGPSEHKKPDTVPANPNKPPDPKRQDDGQQTA
jgi:hypothetical protein